MELKDYMKRYVHYGVVKDEWEYTELLSLTIDAVRALYPYEFPIGKPLEDASIETIKKFNIGFCEGCLFQNVLTIMRLIHYGYEDDEIMKVLEIRKELVEEIRNEFYSRRGTN